MHCVLESSNLLHWKFCFWKRLNCSHLLEQFLDSQIQLAQLHLDLLHKAETPEFLLGFPIGPYSLLGILHLFITQRYQFVLMY